MSGAGLQFGRSRGEDRFYNPARARRNLLSKKNQDHLRRAQSDVTVSQSYAKKDKAEVPPVKKPPENRGGSEEPLKPVDTPALEPVISPLCNIERFLESVTPSVPAQHLSKTTMRGCNACDVESQPYFMLDDLWESFKEWSAYGAGVPLVLNERDFVVQYYVPYLSGFQLYGDSSKCSMKSSRPTSEDSDGDYSRDSSSDVSSDCEHERVRFHYSRDPNHHHLRNDTVVRVDRMTPKDHHSVLQEGFSSDDSESGNSQGCLLFEYLERDPPYSREPLADKIYDLAVRFPQLKNLRSCDLLSSSWISVAWYPIYRIPTGPTLKDLDACFLTFHSLHTPITAAGGTEGPPPSMASYVDEGVPKISLPVFGLASYKFKFSLWTPPPQPNGGGREGDLVNSLFQAADDWLSLLQVNHPDFLFFRRR